MKYIFVFLYFLVFSVSLKSMSLETKAGQQWFYLQKELQPLLYFQEFKKGKEAFHWKRTEVPANLASIDKSMRMGKGIWLRTSFALPKNLQSNSLSIKLGVISDVDIAYINGKKIGSSGIAGLVKPQAYDKLRIYSVPESHINKDGENLLLIYIESKYFSDYLGILEGPIRIDSTEKLLSEFYFQEYVKIILNTVYITFGAYFLFLFLRRRKEKENFMFALFSLILVFYLLFRNQLKYGFGWDFITLKKFEYLVLISPITPFYHFLRYFFGFKYYKIIRILDISIGLVFLYYLLFAEIKDMSFIFLYIVFPLWMIYLSYGFFGLIQQVRNKNRDAIYMFSGQIVIILALVLDTLTTWYIIQIPRLMNYAFFLYILSLAVVLANRFVRLHEEVEELNDNLEQKVKARTEELSLSLSEINQLKIQQDGDYFLTHLLLLPLSGNGNFSKVYKTEMFLRQKKQFEFRGRQYSIGGDTCITDNLILEGKEYIFFANGDAMGKSIQGAGGALVFGVMINAILKRNKQKKDENKNIKQWLYETFNELQSLFESFEGSMLMSVVMGLVEEESGELYFLNAEHPYTVLYRDGIARFIEEDDYLKKLGFPDNMDFFTIKTFQLLEGDVLFIGSDGRDDIRLYQENGEMNYDETLFLKTVEESGGELSEIYNLSSRKGMISDDFSLLKISA